MGPASGTVGAMDDARGRTAYHWALAAVLLPGAGLLVSVVLAFCFRGGVWGRRLAVLAVVDLLLLAALAVLVARPPAAPPDPEAPRIGLAFKRDTPGRVVVESVLPDWPAAEAGFRAGDLLKSIDGVALQDAAQAGREIREGGLRVRTLGIERDGETMEIQVTPRRPVAVQRGLFEAAPRQGASTAGWKAWIGFWIEGAVILALWLLARRRPGPRVWRGFILAAGLFMAGTIGAVKLVEALQGGVSHGGLLIAMILGHSCLGIGGLLGAWWLRADRPAEPPAAMGRGRALLLGVFYVLTCYPRAGVLMLGFDAAFLGGVGKPSDGLSMLAETLHGPMGVALFVLAVAVVGPIAEEVVFRGLLLPRVAARLGRAGALAGTSVLFGAVHSNYGLYAVLTGVLGWILGWTRLASGGLAAPVLLHMLINGAVTLIFFLR